MSLQASPEMLPTTPSAPKRLNDYANIRLFRNKGAAAPTPGAGPAPPNKRREQVRHAQRYVALMSLVIVCYSRAVIALG